MAAAALPAERRRRAIWFGIGAATLLRILFAAIVLQLLAIIGLALAGGVLLLWVAWKLFRELREARAARRAPAATSRRGSRRQKTMTQAVIQIVLADVSMSLDNA